MLGAAKHLLFVIENKQEQIPRFARDDIVRRLFSSLLETKPHHQVDASIRCVAGDGIRLPEERRTKIPDRRAQINSVEHVVDIDAKLQVVAGGFRTSKAAEATTPTTQSTTTKATPTASIVAASTATAATFSGACLPSPAKSLGEAHVERKLLGPRGSVR